MKSERILTAAIVALLLSGVIGVQSGALRLGWVTSAVLRLSASLEVPPLDDPAMVRRGAAHYEIVCAGCHSSPLAPNRADHLRLTPPAPKLSLRRDDWLPEVLFLTVKHGIPNTAMPAWPAKGRDDEIWSIVAFLMVLPDLDAASYRARAGLDAEAAARPGPGAICARCHGVAGRGDATGAFPRLDIQSAEYLRLSLHAYRTGQRQSGFMAGIAGAMDAAKMARLAAHFAAGPADHPPSTPPSVVTEGDMARRLPACTACHGPPDPARPAFPRLAGQSADYLALQLRLFAQNPFTRGGGPFVGLMRAAAHNLSGADIQAAAQWYGKPLKTDPAD